MLVGDKILLRALERADLKRTLQWVNTPEIADALSLSAPISKEQQERWFEALSNDDAKVVFAICDKESGEHIGNVSFRDIDPVDGNARFSIFIAGPEYRGRGVGSEATRLALEYAFGPLDLHKVYLKTTSTNGPAIAMYERLGFVREGCLRQQERRGKTFVDKVLFGILAEEFRLTSGMGSS